MIHRISCGIFLLASALFGAAVAAPRVAPAATVTVVNNDGRHEGFNDPAPVAPIGGNPGVTLGQQRLIAFQFAADIWGARIASPVPIRVGANFDLLPCSSNGAVLGQAGPSDFRRDFSGAPVPNTWYPVALANALHGSDLEPGGDHLFAQFNSSLGTTCPFPRGWYYGLDANAGSGIDFVTVALHELGHGLGFLTIVDLEFGAKAMGFDDTYMLNLEDHTTGKLYPAMTDGERVAAGTNTGNLHWVGANVKAASGTLTAGVVAPDHVRMYAPAAPRPGSSVSHWDTALAPNQIMEPIYTEPLHTPVLETRLFQDIGWTVTSQPTISVLPGSKDYGTVPIGDTSDHDFTVANVGMATLHVSSTSITNPGGGGTLGEFSIANGVNAFDLAPGETTTVTVRFAPALPAGARSAALRLGSDDPDTPDTDVPLSGMARQFVHDLALVKITVPATIFVAPGAPATRPVKVELQNRSNHSEVLPDASTLGDGQTTGLVRLSVTAVDDDLEGCQPAGVALDTARNAAIFKSGAKIVRSKATLTIHYLVTYDCTNAKKKHASDATPGDYTHAATVHREVIDGRVDHHPLDDICPHPALGVDPHPDGRINDKGCGAKKPDRTFGGPVVTNVVAK